MRSSTASRRPAIRERRVRSGEVENLALTAARLLAARSHCESHRAMMPLISSAVE